MSKNVCCRYLTMVILSGFLTLFTTISHAQLKYTRLNFAALNYEQDLDLSNGFSSTATAEPFAVIGAIGYQFHDNFAFEFRGGLGVAGDSGDFVSEFDVDNLLGAYWRGWPNTGTGFSPYLIAGYTRIETNIGATIDNESDFSFGFGADLQISKSLDINIEYMKYYDESETDLFVDTFSGEIALGDVREEITGTSIGLNWAF